MVPLTSRPPEFHSVRPPQTAPANKGSRSDKAFRNGIAIFRPLEAMVGGNTLGSQDVASLGSQTPEGLQMDTPLTLRILHSQFAELPGGAAWHSPPGPQETQSAKPGNGTRQNPKIAITESWGSLLIALPPLVS